MKSFVRYGRRSFIRKIFNFRPRHGIMIIKKVLLPTCLLQLKQSRCFKHYIVIKMRDDVRWGHKGIWQESYIWNDGYVFCQSNTKTAKPTLLFSLGLLWFGFLFLGFWQKAKQGSVLCSCLFSPPPWRYFIYLFLIKWCLIRSLY